MKTIILLIGGILGLIGIYLINLSLDFKYQNYAELKDKQSRLQIIAVTLCLIGVVLLFVGTV